jgi:hypothetical protein
MKRLNFCVVCNEFYAFHVCIAWMIVERSYGSILLCYVHSSIYDFFYLWLGQISIVEAGAITSILFSSWAGADHEILCCNLLSPLLSRPRHHMFAGPRVRWALLQNFTSLSL